MAYYVKVQSNDEGLILAKNLNLLLPQYVMKTAKWSGFGNERVFSRLPLLPNAELTDEEMFLHFNLTEEEVQHVRETMESRRRKN